MERLLACYGSNRKQRRNATQAVHLVRKIGGITVRGNHDEMVLERYDTWKRTGTLDVRARLSCQQTY